MSKDEYDKEQLISQEIAKIHDFNKSIEQPIVTQFIEDDLSIMQQMEREMMIFHDEELSKLLLDEVNKDYRKECTQQASSYKYDGEYLKSLREKYDLSPTEFCMMYPPLHTTTLSRWESGTHTPARYLVELIERDLDKQVNNFLLVCKITGDVLDRGNIKDIKFKKGINHKRKLLIEHDSERKHRIDEAKLS